MNVVILFGVVSKEPDLKFTKTQKSVTNFVLKVSRGYKDEKGGFEVCDFILCRAWGKLGESLSRNIHKGDLLSVRGQYTVEQFKPYGADKATYNHYVLVKSVDFAGMTMSKVKEYAEQYAMRGSHEATQQAVLPAGNSFDELGTDENVDVSGLDF